MELFPAADEDAWTLIKRVIDESDYYLLVIGGKYGSIDPIEDLSYTEMEYDYASQQGKPVMAFLHGAPESLPVSDAEIEKDRRDKLEAFRAKVKAHKHVKFWTSADGLAGQVALSFNRFTRLYPATGWIRADRATSTESLQALADARAELDQLRQQVESSRVEGPGGTQDLSQGDDKVVLPINSKGEFWPERSPMTRVQTWVHIEMTWNQILGAIGPRLLHECEETQLRSTLDEWVVANHFDRMREGLAERYAEARGSLPKGRFMDLTAEIDDEDFGTILVQLKVLGIIAHSDRRRSVADTGTYWTLTPYGESQVMKLRAIRKKPGGAAALAGAEPRDTEDLDDMSELVD